jgi:hypothetical protein
MALTATDEEGYSLSGDRLRVMTAFVEFACGRLNWRCHMRRPRR